MELLIVVILLVGLALPPPRWGRDGDGNGLEALAREPAAGGLSRPIVAGAEAYRETLLRSERAPRPSLLGE